MTNPPHALHVTCRDGVQLLIKCECDYSADRPCELQTKLLDLGGIMDDTDGLEAWAASVS